MSMCFHPEGFICIYFEINRIADYSFVFSSSWYLYLEVLFKTLLLLPYVISALVG
jgi:hypothetical protein